MVDSGNVVRSTNPCSVGRFGLWTTSICSSLESRPITPAIGGRSLAQVPRPRNLFARRRGGSPGSVCGMPFFSRILIHLVGLRSGIGQRALRQRRPGALLQLMPQFQQMATATTQLACQSGGRSTLDDAAYDQEELRGGTMGTVQRRVGPGIENPATSPAAVIEDGCPMTAIN